MQLDAGLVFLSDSRTNAGVDQVSTARKMTVFEQAGERLMVLMTAGNLAISQAVLQRLKFAPTDAIADGDTAPSLWNAANMHQAAQIVGDAVREVYARDAASLKQFEIEFNVSIIFGGQIGAERPRLFQIYAAGNFIEARPENTYFQIGESKYGKPIIDRVVTPATALDEAAKCALISMDSTLRSNVSVGMPLDLLVYEAGSLAVTRFSAIGADNLYYNMIHNTWGKRLKQVFQEIPDPSWGQAADADLNGLVNGVTVQPVRATPRLTSTAEQGARPAAALQSLAQN